VLYSFPSVPEFQSPIYGSRTRGRQGQKDSIHGFQSPIYGSRTANKGLPVNSVTAFQSPIYGSRTRSRYRTRSSATSFNPLSTGHAPLGDHPQGYIIRVSIPYLRVTHVDGPEGQESIAEFQSPIYGSRTERHPGPSIGVDLVSIPYLRVTHYISGRYRIDLPGVSIPYLRVTHLRKTGGSEPVLWVSIPYLRVTHAEKHFFREPRMNVSIPYLRVTHSGYIVPQNGGSCVSIPYLRVTHLVSFSCLVKGGISFNPLSTGHALVLHCIFFIYIYTFQSPIYGSRTYDFSTSKQIYSGFNPLSTGHAHASTTPAPLAIE